ncbi:MAG: enoyl-CoA hydratase-related protein [Bacteroidota bacterium]
MDFNNILTNLQDGILTITINRPDKLNALNTPTISELKVAFKEVYDNDAIRGVIVTGSGTKAFVAGADISEFTSLSVEQGAALSASGHILFDMIEACPKPVVAAVNGFSLGGGNELAMSCHIRVASDNAKFGQPEVKLGLIPGYGATQRLVQLIGKGKALEYLMTADMMTAEQAEKLGMVNYVTTPDQLMAKALEVLNKILVQSPMAISAIIRSVNAYFTDGVNGYKVEIEEFGKCFGTEDFKEGTSAFMEKRKASFTGK